MTHMHWFREYHAISGATSAPHATFFITNTHMALPGISIGSYMWDDKVGGILCWEWYCYYYVLPFFRTKSLFLHNFARSWWCAHVKFFKSVSATWKYSEYINLLQSFVEFTCLAVCLRPIQKNPKKRWNPHKSITQWTIYIHT